MKKKEKRSGIWLRLSLDIHEAFKSQLQLVIFRLLKMLTYRIHKSRKGSESSTVTLIERTRKCSTFSLDPYSRGIPNGMHILPKIWSFRRFIWTYKAHIRSKSYDSQQSKLIHHYFQCSQLFQYFRTNEHVNRHEAKEQMFQWKQVHITKIRIFFF